MGQTLERMGLEPGHEASSGARHARPRVPAPDHAECERRDAAPGASEARYRALYDDLPLMVFRLDSKGKVLSVNEHGARELGYAAGELIGRPVLRVFHPEDRQAAERQLGWSLDSPSEVSRWELRKVRKDGSVLWVRETVRVVRSASGATEILVVCEDVTERRRAVQRVAEYRDQLRELNAELSSAEERGERRIACVLHDEVGQTLAAARMGICELRDSEGSSERIGRLEELRELVDRTIEATRSLTFQLSPPILYELGLAAALEALGERIGKESGIRFAFALGEGWTSPAEDASVVLFRVVRELLHNVTKHARASRARLELDGAGDRARIVLEDDGVGFGAVIGKSGHGLGLFHVRERMQRLGGRFEIDSAPGRGTRAVLTLPLCDEPERRRRERRRSP